MKLRNALGIIILAMALFVISFGVAKADAHPSASPADEEITLTLVGSVTNTQDAAIEEAEISILWGKDSQMLIVSGEEMMSVHTDEAGFFFVNLELTRAQLEQKPIFVEAKKHGYRNTQLLIQEEEIACKDGKCYLKIPSITMPRAFNAAFFVATGIFLVIFIFISLNILHETIAAFLGAAAMLGVSYFLGSSYPNFWIIGFHRAVEFIDFDVIFLLMTMMIFMAIMSQTGVFQWLAFQTFRICRGEAFLVTALLVIITGVTSAVLNDTTVMLLMTPVSIQIALALNMNPASIVVPEVLASNIGGSATLIGTPPNTIIGSYVGLSFNQFLGNMLPISIMGMIILLLMTRWIFRDEFGKDCEPASEVLTKRLEKDAQIRNMPLLRKSLILFGITLVLFFVEDYFHMPPAVVAIIGSTALLLWVRPNVSEMLREVDWTTLVFFMSLFMMVGGVQEVGLIQIIAESVRTLAGENLMLATLLIIWVAAIASAIVANIPFAAAIVPVTVFLTQTIPGAENNVLYWALALGAGLGGNATYIGSAPNIVAMGVMDRAGFRMTFKDYSRIAIPITFVTILVPTFWMLIRYFWLNF